LPIQLEALSVIGATGEHPAILALLERKISKLHLRRFPSAALCSHDAGLV
jgi:hypothetical protein